MAISVALSTGATVDVGRLRWPGYVKLKTSLACILQGHARDIQDLFKGAGGLTAPDFTAIEDWASRLADAIRDADAEFMAITPDLVRACLPTSETLQELPAVDWLRLREAVFEANPLKELFELEQRFFKQAIAAVVDPKTTNT